MNADLGDYRKSYEKGALLLDNVRKIQLSYLEIGLLK